MANKRKIDVKESKAFKDRYGNIIRRKRHERNIDVPNVSNKTKKAIKTGKAKRLKSEGEFIDSFKDKRKKKRKSEQTNLDKQLGINTKLLDEYKDLKTFDKHQKRLF